jgi:predicted nucleotidyltransferase component of viral defense system
MNDNIIKTRLQRYTINTIEDEEYALKEILQELVLYGLSNTDFFKYGLFHGGTSLRILHGLPRFSEDLDFLLKKPYTHFIWQPYMDAIHNTCQKFGIEPDIRDKSQIGKNIQKMFFKDNSIGKILNLTFHHHPQKKLTIKLEIDINPPLGSKGEVAFLDFPIAFSLASQDMPSNFAGKCHALLCRPYTKGRDWYDFLWYVAKGILPNLHFLSNALDQQGPWTGQKIKVDFTWFRLHMEKKIKEVDWQKTSADVRPFLSKLEKQTLSLWSEKFFLHHLERLMKQGA